MQSKFQKAVNEDKLDATVMDAFIGHTDRLDGMILKCNTLLDNS